MLQNHLKIALRNMTRQRGFALINLAGLTIGLTVCFLIFMWVSDELSYDKFHAKSERVYRPLWEAKYGDNEWKIPLIPVPVAPTLKQEFPEVEGYTHFVQGGFNVKKGDDYVREDRVYYVDDGFFDVFTVEFVDGNAATALEAPDAVVLTEEMAAKYFPDQDPIGKTIESNDGNLYRVTGVAKGFPKQSHFHFDFLASSESLEFIERRKDQWGSATVYSYITLRPDADVAALEAKWQNYVKENITDAEFRASGNYSRFPLQPLEEIHLQSNLEYELEANGKLSYVYLFSVIAFIILILACINFVNLSTARSLMRAREVGVRKVLGSRRGQLIRQFFAESFVYVLISVIGAAILARAVLPAFNNLAGKEMQLNFLSDPMVLAILAGLTIVVTLLAGSFPALFMSSFSPATVLKGEVTKSGGTDWLRKGLVVAQFCISTGLIIGTLVVMQQLQFLQHQNLGFDKEHVIVIDRAEALGDQYLTFLNELASIPSVETTAAAQGLPSKGFDSTIFEPEQPANYETTSLAYAFVDENYVDVLQLNMLEGRNFSMDFASDSSAFIINEAAAEKLGWDEPLGKELNYGNGFVKGPVIGVVEDYHFRSLHHEVEPMILIMGKWNLPHIAVRVQPGDIAESVDAISALWKEFLPNSPFQYSFLDEDYQQLYESEQRMSSVFIIFAILAIFIACLGLLGLAAYVAERRTKEIGIRKVLGASIPDIIAMLSKDFLVLVLIATLIAFPLAWWGMSNWLDNFAYRTDLNWWIFAIAGLAMIVIALLTVASQAIKAAFTNPIESLRDE
jgi:putative ABC transport system permease protein